MSEGERFQRLERQIGGDKLRRLRESLVTVAGLGAVGSYAVEGLARAGVGRLRLVDFDIVKPSNINRQLYALDSTVGQPKAELAGQRVRDINPDCAVEALRCFIHRETMEAVLGGPPDLLIDAIDSLAPKVELLAAASQRGIPIISSMGAARRQDATLIRTGPLAQAQACPLARVVRKRLRRLGVAVDFTCVYSLERPAALPRNEGEPEPDFLERGRRRQPLGSLPTITGIYGLMAAHEALRRLLGGL